MATTMLITRTAPPRNIVQSGVLVATQTAVITHANANARVAVTERARCDTRGLATVATSASKTATLPNTGERPLEDVMTAASSPDPAYSAWHSSVLLVLAGQHRTVAAGRLGSNHSESTASTSQTASAVKNFPGKRDLCDSPYGAGRMVTSCGAASIRQYRSGRIFSPRRRLTKCRAP
jgi:hypothetical protein